MAHQFDLAEEADDEQMIVEELEEMGVEITNAVLTEIKKELQVLKGSEKDDSYFESVSQLDDAEKVFEANARSLLKGAAGEMEDGEGNTPSSFSQLVYKAQPLAEHRSPFPQPQFGESGEPKNAERARKSRLDPSIDMQGLIEEGYIRLQKVYEYIRHMEQKIEADEGCGLDEDEIDFQSARKPRRHEVDSRHHHRSRRRSPSIKRKGAPQEEGKENQPPAALIESSRGQTGTREVGGAKKEEIREEPEEDPRLLLKKYYKLNALRPVLNVEPGRLPYRHDQVERMRQYREEWAKNPLPHEKRRLTLRWRIRDMMLKRDWREVKMAAPPLPSQKSANEDGVVGGGGGWKEREERREWME